MKQKFFTNSIQSNFIKALIYNIPIPLLNTVNENSYLIEGNNYIYRDKVIKCIESGILKMPEMDDGYEAYYKNGDIQLYHIPDQSTQIETSPPTGYTLLNRAKYRTIEDFIFGKYYPKSTEIHISKYNYYDSPTHEFLGKLLRCVRDIYDIDLMPFYNCVSGRYISHLIIDKGIVKSGKTDEFKTFKIPVKFNTTYTIALDCSSNVKIAPALLSNDHLIDDIHLLKKEGIVESYNPQEKIIENNTYNFSSTSFKHPITVGFDIINLQDKSNLYKYENYLYMLIQIPITNNSSLVVLEGDYTKTGIANYYSADSINNLNDLQLSNIMISNLSLLSINDGVIWPYSNRLIEYLVNNVITSREVITKNISYVQDLFPKPDVIPEVWNNALRSDIYINYQRPDFVEKIDLNGFVDKDTEALMNKIKY